MDIIQEAIGLTVAMQYTTVYPKKYTHGFVVLCFVVVTQSFIMNSHEVFIHIHQGCFAGTGAIARLPQCQWSKPDGYGKICQCITTTKHSKAKTVCIFLGIYCILWAKILHINFNIEMIIWVSYRRCSNCIFILDLTSGFNGLGTDNCRIRQDTFKFGICGVAYINDLTVSSLKWLPLYLGLNMFMPYHVFV